MSRPPLLTPTLSAVFVLLWCSVQGCAIGDYLGAYFNTFYNAQRAYDEAEAELLASEARLANRAFLAPYAVSQAQRNKFTSVIEKCSKLLQYYPASRFVDDALMMIGKSYYYQNENQQALRKFDELIEGYPESPHVPEARLLRAQVFYKQGNKEESGRVALDIVQAADAAGPTAYVADASLLLAQIEIDRESLARALPHFERAALAAPSRAERTAALLRLADAHFELGDYEKAAQVYLRAEKMSNEYGSEFKARHGYARSIARMGKHDEALDLLEDLLSNTNYREFFGHVELEIGNVFKTMGDYDEAIAQYRHVDTSYARSEVSATSCFERGDLYERILLNYDSARVAYNKGKLESTQAKVIPQLARRSEYLNKYHGFRAEIARYDSIRTMWLTLPDTSELHTPREAAELDTMIDDDGNIDTLENAVAEDIDDVDAPKDPEPAAPGDTLGRTDTLAVSRGPVIPSIPLDTAEARIAYNAMELAGLFYSTIGNPDSAAEWYRVVLREYGETKFAARALFTLARIHSEDRGRQTSVDSLYHLVVDRYPDSEFAAEARRILGLAPQARLSDPADERYRLGEQLLLAGDHRAAVATLRDLIHAFPQSPVVSKALYAMGWIYQERIHKPDSAIALYRALVDSFPSSAFAGLVRPKLAEVDASQAARRAAIQDSLRRAAAQADSIKAAAEKQREPAPAKRDSVGKAPDVKQPPSEEGKEMPQP